MMTPNVLIVGGGLAGLTAARLLHRADIPFRLLEARDRLGGRIVTVDTSGTPASSGFDLGPAWFWPSAQPTLATLVEQLGITTFVQHEEGELLLQRSPHQPAQRINSLGQDYPSARINGGTAALINRLAAGLPDESICLSSKVTQAALKHGQVELTIEGSGKAETTETGSHVIFALPPRLLEATVAFSPTIDPNIALLWRATPTWMAPNAKVFSIYSEPFWRHDGLSGGVRSTVGPLVEVHDATTPDGQAALFGFVGVPATQRKQMGQDAVIDASLRQLVDLFGPQAGHPIGTVYKDWALDPLTATTDDSVATGHPAINQMPWLSGEWVGKAFLAGSETSDRDPGLLAGAVQAAEREVRDLVATLLDAS